MSQNIDIKDWYISSFTDFEGQLNGEKGLPFHKVRKDALSKFAELGFPTTRQEAWKYTNISPILKHQFALSKAGGNVTAENLKPFILPGCEQNYAVIVNGFFDTSLSNLTAAEGLVASSLKAAFESHAELVNKHLSKYAKYTDDTFCALNTAYATDGVFVHVAKNAQIEAPLQLLFISVAGDKPQLSSPRNLVIVEESAEAVILESHHAVSDSTYFTNQVTEVVMAKNAKLEHVRIQDESLEAFQVATTEVHQLRDSHYSSVNIDLGGAIARNNLNVTIDGEYTNTDMIGFYYGSGRQLIDNHTFIDHAVPNCESNELYKGILADRAHGVFNGRVLVRQDAQKTNAFQQNQGLLLSDNATIDAKPELEIFADDVKCSHGATIGELDEDQLMYLRSRGIDAEYAHALLRIAFARDVFNHISLEPVREHLEARIIERFAQN